LRKHKKAVLTETALKGIKAEAGKAGLSLEAALQTCCERGWAGFKADWVKRDSVETYLPHHRRVFESYNAVMAGNGWPEADTEAFSKNRAYAIDNFLKLSAKPGDWVTAYFEWLADALEPRTTTGFDWAIREETFLRAKEGTFAMRAAQ
jgi:hypothetical protein